MRATVILSALTEEEKLRLALKLLDEDINMRLEASIFGDLMEDSGEVDWDVFLDHVLGFLAMGSTIHLKR